MNPEPAGRSGLEALRTRLIQLAESRRDAVSARPETPLPILRLALHGLVSPGIGHEINNCLTCVVGYSQFVLRQQKDSLPRDEVSAIEREALRAGKLIRDMVALGRGRAEEPGPAPLGPLLGQLERVCRAVLRKSGTTLRVEWADAAPSAPVRYHETLDGLMALLLGCSAALDCYATFHLSLLDGASAPDLALAVTRVERASGVSNRSVPGDSEVCGMEPDWLLDLALRLLGAQGIALEVSARTEAELLVTVGFAGAGEAAVSGEARKRTDRRVLIAHAEPPDVSAIRRMLEQDGFRVYVVRDEQAAVSRFREQSCDLVLINVDGCLETAQSTYRRLSDEAPAAADRAVFLTDAAFEEGVILARGLGRPVLSRVCDRGELYRVAEEILKSST